MIIFEFHFLEPLLSLWYVSQNLKKKSFFYIVMCLYYWMSAKPCIPWSYVAFSGLSVQILGENMVLIFSSPEQRSWRTIILGWGRTRSFGVMSLFRLVHCKPMIHDSILWARHLGPVVQSIVSLTTSLVDKMLTVLESTISNLQVLLLNKKCE